MKPQACWGTSIIMKPNPNPSRETQALLETMQKLSEQLNAQNELIRALEEKIPKLIEDKFKEIFESIKITNSLNEDNDLISFKEAMQILRCSRQSIYNYILNCDLKPLFRIDSPGNKKRGQKLSKKAVTLLFKKHDRNKS